MTANHGLFRNHEDDEPELEKLDFPETNDVNQTFHSEGAEPKSLRISHESPGGSPGNVSNNEKDFVFMTTMGQKKEELEKEIEGYRL